MSDGAGGPAGTSTAGGPRASTAAVAPPVGLTVLYDETCQLCLRVRDWLAGQRLHVPMELLAAGSPQADRRYGALPWRGRELVVAAWDGRIWVGPEAYVMCLWATRRYRAMARRLAAPGLAPLARRFFVGLSARRSAISARLHERPDCADCRLPPEGAAQ